MIDDVKDIAGDIADFIGFSEPEKGPLSDFHTFAPDMMNLFMQGIKDNKAKLDSTINSTFDIEGDIKSGMSYDGVQGVPIATGSLNQPATSDQTIILQIDGDTFGKFVYKYGEQTKTKYGIKLAEAVSV